jgi:hypothetical protein
MLQKANKTQHKEYEIMDSKTVIKQAEAIKDAVIDRVEHITPTEKIVGAAVIGAAVGAAAVAVGSAMLHSDPTPAVPKKAADKPAG